MNNHRTPIKILALVLCVLTLFTGCMLQSSPTPVNNNSSPVSGSSSLASSLPNESSYPSSADSSSPTATETEEFQFSFHAVPTYSGTPYVTLHNNLPVFSQDELSQTAIEQYSPLDSLGRCGTAFAICGTEIMPKEGETRGSISHVKPSGWVQAQYDFVDGKYLYNRCHLLGWQLSAENDNKSNLVTGTRYMNTQGMLPFENMIADYIQETGNHVAYRVTPRFKDKELVARGIELEAYSVEDQGDGICFHVYVYNLQPQVTIDYETGTSALAQEDAGSVPTETTQEEDEIEEEADQEDEIVVYITPTGSRYHYNSTCGGKNSKESTMEKALGLGLTPCKNCAS